jgi:hypothetical protein
VSIDDENSSAIFRFPWLDFDLGNNLNPEECDDIFSADIM